MSRAVLSLGSNLGDRYRHLVRAIAALGDALLVVSGVYETAAWPGSPPGEAGVAHPEPPPYLNAAALVADNVPAREWLARAGSIEQAEGRVRDPAWRFSPRTLDIDVIAVWTDDGEPVTCAGVDLTLPHPRAHLRAFVLRPWLDIQPYARLPGHGPIAELLRSEPVAAQLAGLQPRPDLVLAAGGEAQTVTRRRVTFRSSEGE